MLAGDPDTCFLLLRLLIFSNSGDILVNTHSAALSGLKEEFRAVDSSQPKQGNRIRTHGRLKHLSAARSHSPTMQLTVLQFRVPLVTTLMGW